MKNVYLAASFSRKDEMVSIRDRFESFGLTVVSNWMYESVPVNQSVNEYSPAYLKKVATTDIEELNQADVLVLFSNPSGTVHSGGGRYFEMGYMYSRQKPIIVVGTEETVFHYLPEIIYVPTTYAAISHILGDQMATLWRDMRDSERTAIMRREQVIEKMMNRIPIEKPKQTHFFHTLHRGS